MRMMLLRCARLCGGGSKRPPFSALSCVAFPAAFPSPSTSCLFSSGGNVAHPPPGQVQDEWGRPSNTQLNHICIRVGESVPLVFRRQMDYTFYRVNMVLEDRIFNMSARSLREYWHRMATIRYLSFFTTTYCEIEALSIVPFLEDGTVRLRWRVSYVSLLRGLNFVRNPPSKYAQNAEWFDGYSIFYVGGDGLVYRVVFDKVMPDDERAFAKAKSPVQKMAEKMGVVPAISNESAHLTSNQRA